ncbi:putative swib mdm2 domain protein [Phaeomoniella chlamydospora]|uniref:Putative swib mdm2 domain protein n=1 Tax=Phaeomoniella chlamydospora TaxID=158046 RepID=A0A0G2F431_PHACM|nr:putative swib mdm2 domain protein [Phaeomoniella chlamydospora]
MAKFDEVRDQYVKVIDGILAASDLSTVSQKRIRKGIQEAVDFDITPHKASINDLILERFDEFNARQNGAGAASQKNTETAASPTPPTTNGHATTSPSPSPVKRQSESEELSEVADDAPPKKKRKPDNVDSDALIAARLQAEENARARPTRGGSTRKATPAKKRASKKKTEKKVRAEDDSDLSGSEADKPVKNTGFHVSGPELESIESS